MVNYTLSQIDAQIVEQKLWENSAAAPASRSLHPPPSAQHCSCWAQSILARSFRGGWRKRADARFRPLSAQLTFIHSAASDARSLARASVSVHIQLCIHGSGRAR